MSPTEHRQALPSFNLILGSDHYKTVLPNLSYPFRPNAHIPWSGSSGPLLFANTTSPAIATSNPNVQVPTTANIYFDTGSVPAAFHGISILIWYNLSLVVRKLKLIKQKLFGVSATGPSISANV